MNILNRLDSIMRTIGDTATGVNRLRLADTPHTARYDAGTTKTDHVPVAAEQQAKPLERRVDGSFYLTGRRRSSDQ